MHTTLLTDPSVPGADEDAAGVLGDVAVLLDGAGVPARFRAGCRHSVAWYSHTLAALLLARAQDTSVSLTEVLRAGIAQIAGLHADECALEEGGPSATVVLVRRTPPHLEHLVLCDSSLLLTRRDGGVERVTDRRVEEVVARGGGAERIEAQRNAPGGFWVARHEPEAAAQARVGSTPLAELFSVHLVSDGVTRAVELLGLHDDASLARALDDDPGAVIAQIRGAEDALADERAPRKRHDDASVLTLHL
ncbi:protein phosphatase 2C domain-containing protein [Brachybacterium aquaticum]|uniref:PPM-type phosphatase domain-containing protein n=1 Tax=Brachybacterium aquaticum TaxID=1432564 RepID=A0A841ABR9_9MICO|nr:protein phosphatase 2C domain-containing protein [Brachybacterium aquaticum]MBB5832669.1 hypothetical protein [Brachybacterium aquaticum]